MTFKKLTKGIDPLEQDLLDKYFRAVDVFTDSRKFYSDCIEKFKHYCKNAKAMWKL